MKKNGLTQGIKETYREEYKEIGVEPTRQDMEALALACAIRTEPSFNGGCLDILRLEGVTEYIEEFMVEICESSAIKGEGRLVIAATNEGGCNRTEVDLLQLLHWIKTNRPDLLV